ncbi:MAG: glutathione S-transferase N-terminal domain-containing protein [Alphaproteobacteria bacterium]|nr:glutathione S-transferase N-terminal domain-containing protein [Alphaproteobacteria bacterium]
MVKAKAATSGRRGNRSSPAVAAKPNKKKTAKRAAPRPGKGKTPGNAKARIAKAPAPIELYYWPTPNGWKISIMLEECRLPYVLKPVNISKGEQFAPAFLKISPNNRMPAIVDPAGPGGRPISVFESGAILQYLGRKTGKFYPADERRRVAVDEWLFWQMGGLGPMTGQANHFANYAPEKIPYAITRYRNEVNRLFGVMDKQLTGRDYLAGAYSIADMASIGWVLSGIRLGEDMAKFPRLAAWVERLQKRPAVQRGLALGKELRQVQANDPKAQEEARKILFGQRARP